MDKPQRDGWCCHGRSPAHHRGVWSPGSTSGTSCGCCPSAKLNLGLFLGYKTWPWSLTSLRLRAALHLQMSVPLHLGCTCKTQPTKCSPPSSSLFLCHIGVQNTLRNTLKKMQTPKFIAVRAPCRGAKRVAKPSPTKCNPQNSPPFTYPLGVQSASQNTVKKM